MSRSNTLGRKHPRRNVWLMVAVTMLAVRPGSTAEPSTAPIPHEQAQETNEAPTASLGEAITALTKAVEADGSLESAAKEAMLAELRGASDLLQQRETLRGEASALAEAASTAPERVETLRAELAVAPQPPKIDAPEGMPLEEVRRAAQEAVAQHEAARVELQRVQADAANRITRLDEIPRLVTDLKARLAEVDEELGDEVTGLTLEQAARRLRRRADRELIAGQIQRLEAESASYRARQELVPLRRDLAQRRLDQAADIAAQWQALETNLMRQEALAGEREAARQQMEAALLAEPLQVVAAQTAAFAARRTGPTGIVEQLSKARARLNEVQKENSDLQARVMSTRSKMQAAGLSEAIGVVLRHELYGLPKTQPLRNELEAIGDEIGGAQYMLIVADEELAKVSDIEAAVPRLVAQITPGSTAASTDVITSAARSLLTNRRDVLAALRTEYSTFIAVGSDLDTALRERVESTDAYRRFIEERILWTRSVAGRRLPQWRDLADGTRWLIESPRWGELLSGMSPGFVSVLLATLLAASLYAARIARRRLAAIAEQVRRFTTDRFALTLEALALTLLAAAPWPLLVWLLASLIDPAVNQLAAAVAPSLRDLATMLLALELVRHALRPGGLVDAHFRWTTAGVADLQRCTLGLELIALPLGGIAIIMGAQSNELWNDALGRLAFVAAMVVVAAILAHAFAPWRSLASGYYARHPKGALSRARWLLYPMIAGLPLLMACLALLGYFYTATAISQRLHLTAALVLVVVVVYSLVIRWLFVERRRLLVERARQKRAVLTGEGPPDQPVENDLQLDLPEIDAQTRRVVVAAVVTSLVIGVYGLWADALPALQMLGRVQVWPSITILEDGHVDALPEALMPEPPAPAANGGMAAPGLPAIDVGPQGGSTLANTVTIDEVALSILVFVLTYVLSRNLPGLLEITLLKRLPMDAGARFAISAVLRYVIAVVGILLAFGVLGIGWTKVQWLVAALTFGLAFGLQEIFANFISGLIILAERPIRVGDTVTVGGVSGTVSQIRMRATTVRDWTLKELIIPNKVFITDQVVNWTLSDPRLRLDVPIGVSYGSDVRLVERTLMELARSQPHVLEEPAPRSLFVGFGDSTLNFEVRVYLEHFDYFLVTRTALHMEITERFRELGIEIAFPQRDLHVRSAGPIEKLLEERREQTKDSFTVPPQ